MKGKLQVALLRGGWNELMIAGFSHRSTGIGREWRLPLWRFARVVALQLLLGAGDLGFRV